MLPEFEKLWATVTEARASEKTPKRLAARIWLVLFGCIAFVACLGFIQVIIGLVPNKRDTDTAPGSTYLQSPADVAYNPRSVERACVEITKVASGYDLSDPSQHLAAKAALEKAISQLPDIDRNVLASLQQKYLEPQWISGNPSAALSKLIAALGCP